MSEELSCAAWFPWRKRHERTSNPFRRQGPSAGGQGRPRRGALGDCVRRTAAGCVDQSASAGQDYAQRFGTLTFAPGETSKSVAVIVNGDVTIEPDETLRLILTSPSNAVIADGEDGEGTGTIVNDDGLTEGLFYTVVPCRLLDTRSADQGPAAVSGEVVVVAAHGNCGLPATARALAVNVTVTAAAELGTLTLWDGGNPIPDTLTVAFAAGQTRANNAIVHLAADGSFALSPDVAGGGSVHVIVDVSGYFE